MAQQADYLRRMHGTRFLRCLDERIVSQDGG